MKRAEQSGGPAVTLIGLMTLLFILYILFLPPSEREALLDGEDYENGAKLAGILLLDESPGRIEFIDKNVIDHTLSNIFLTAQSNAKELARINPFVIRKGWFSKETKTYTFTLNELPNTKNVVLSLQAPLRKGRLMISLNGQSLYQGYLNNRNPPPIQIPTSLLSSSNEISFWVEGGFFQTKRYEILDIKILGDILDTQRQIASSTFSISDTELENLDTSAIDFYPLCDQRSSGVLTITLNARNIYSSVPSCESLNRQELYKQDFLSGKNTLTWTLQKGSMRVEQLRIRNTLEKIDTYIDYFEINQTLYNKVLDNTRDIILKVEFVDDDTRHQARININGAFDVIDQEKAKYEEEISNKIREGNNYIEIKPLRDLQVARLQIEVE